MSDATPSSPTPASAGWYPDPQNPGQQRYWDGTAWTATAPVVAPAPSPPTSTNAIVGFVLSVVSWLLCPVVPAIIALVLARLSSKEITASGGRVGGAGFNTATRIIAWLNIAAWIIAGIVIAVLAALGVIFTANVASTLDPSINSRTGLADGTYLMNPSRRVNFDNECSYGGEAGMPGMSNPRDVTVYGKGPVECPDLVEVSVVTIEVQGGVARVVAVQ